jgi:peroxiredoxin
VGLRVSLLASIAILATAAAGCASSSVGPAQTSAAAPPPVVTLGGEPTDLASVAHGRVALVSLWATWCDGCQRELDALNRLDATTAPAKDAVVIGVAVGEPRETVAAFVRRRGLRYTQLVDEDFRFADSLGERRVPATLVFDRAGRIVFRGDALDERGLAALRDALGGEGDDPQAHTQARP